MRASVEKTLTATKRRSSNDAALASSTRDRSGHVPALRITVRILTSPQDQPLPPPRREKEPLVRDRPAPERVVVREASRGGPAE